MDLIDFVIALAVEQVEVGSKVRKPAVFMVEARVMVDLINLAFQQDVILHHRWKLRPLDFNYLTVI